MIYPLDGAMILCFSCGLCAGYGTQVRLWWVSVGLEAGCLDHLCCLWECERGNAGRERRWCPDQIQAQRAERNCEFGCKNGLHVVSSRSWSGAVLGTKGYNAAKGY